MRMPRPSPVQNYLDSLQAKGRYTFTHRELSANVPTTSASLKLALHRLGKKRRILRVHNGFYVLVPLEYQASGILPPTWFTHDLMTHLGCGYYVALLTAARLHGAGHQASQEFQVMTDAPLRNIQAGGLRIRLLRKTRLAITPIQEKKVPTGFLRVSTPEATALDLVRYAHAAGGLDNVATVLSELAELIDGQRLIEVAEIESQMGKAPIQRLGYILEFLGENNLAASLASWLDTRRVHRVPLQVGVPLSRKRTSTRWKVAINHELEPDL